MYKLSCSSSIKWFSSSFLVNHSSLDCGERGTKKIFYLFSPVPFKVKKKKKHKQIKSWICHHMVREDNFCSYIRVISSNILFLKVVFKSQFK